MDRRKQLILHCGLPKTGTTALQVWLSQVSKERSAAFDYPGPLLDFEPKQGFVVAELKAGGELAEIRRVLTKATSKVVVMSNEGLSNHLYDFDPSALREFRDMTKCWSVHAVMVTREREAWLRSYHRQCILNPNNGASDLWGTSATLEQIRSHPRILALLDHARLAGDMKKAFGAKRVLTLEYEQAWFQEFRRLFRLRVDLGVDLPRTNSSVPGWAIEVLRVVNERTDDPVARLAWRSAMQRHLGSESVQLLQAAAATDQSPDLALIDHLSFSSDSRADEEAFGAFRATLVPSG